MSKKRVGRYPEAFRRMAVERMKDCANVSELARELGVDRAALYHRNWKDDDFYKKAFDRLLRHLKAENKADSAVQT